MTTVTPLSIPDVKSLAPKLHHDNRGYVTEIVNETTLRALGLPAIFPQENQSFSLRKNTVRGLHAQKPPHAQAKLVRVLQGRIFDVAVDVRPASPTFGQHTFVEVSAQDMTQLYVPAGFLHGFCTLEDNTIVVYKMSTPYTPASECAVLWNDPDLNIPWPVNAQDAILSNKDAQLQPFKNFPKIDW